MKRTRPLAALAGLALGLSGTAFGQLFPVDPNDLAFRQVNLAFQGLAPVPDSPYGFVAADSSSVLFAATGGALTRGYLNISTEQGWVVRNLPLDETSGYAGLGVYFDLGETPGVLQQIRARASIAAAPQLTHPALDPADPFAPVSPMEFNAQGAGGGGAGPGSAPRPANPTVRIDKSTIVFAGQENRVAFQAQHPNIEQALNQCYPGAVANSLVYLQNSTGIKTTAHNHVAGERDNSLVGRLDVAMNRPAGQYTPSALDMVRGKMNYLDDNDLDDKVMTEHKQATGIDWLNGDISSTAGNATSTEDTSATKLIDWIIDKVAAGKDVKIRIGWDAGGGHAVQLIGAGVINGERWIAYAHDAKQGAAGGVGLFDGGLGFSWVDPDTNALTGFLPGFIGKGTVSFAVAEMAVPTPHTTAILALAALAAWRRRR